MIKLIATDLDGTLLSPGGRTVSERNLAVLSKAAEMGVKVIVCTGRMFMGGQRFAQLIPGDQPVIAVNGAVIRMSRSLEYLRRVSIPAAELADVMKYLRNEHISPWFYYGDICYAEAVTERLEELVNRTGVTARIVNPLESLTEACPEKVLSVGSPEMVAALQDKLSRAFEGRLYVTRSSPGQLEIMSPESTKGRALEMLAQHFGIRKEEVIAFGDNLNDIELFSGAGIKVAMGNGEQCLKERADIIAPSNADSGVGQIVEKLVLEGVDPKTLMK